MVDNIFFWTSADELFKSAAYLTEAFTGVQLPTLASTSDTTFPANTVLSGKSTIPSTSGYVINDPTPCASTKRSSSVLTHIVYPEDDNVHPLPHSLPTKESLERVGSRSPPTGSSIPSQLHPPPFLSPIEASEQAGENCLQSRNTTRPEKLLAFNLAFHTGTPYFEWLENGGEDLLGGTGQGARICIPTKKGSIMPSDVLLVVPRNEPKCAPGKPFRLQRFSKAMTGTTGWEAPKAILSGKLLTFHL